MYLGDTSLVFLPRLIKVGFFFINKLEEERQIHFMRTLVQRKTINFLLKHTLEGIM